MTRHAPFWLTALLVATSLLAPIAPARAAEIPAGSIHWVPADVAFFTTSLRNREQFEIILKSKAFSRLKKLPAMKLFWQKLKEEMGKPGSPLKEYEAFVKDPENQQLVDLVVDMLSHEFFFAGGDSMVDFVKLGGQMGGLSSSFAQAAAAAQGGGVVDEKAQTRALLRALASNPELIKVPDLIMGFKLTDTKRAQAQLARLDALIKQGVKQSKDVKIGYKKAKINGGEFLSLLVKLDQVPWDEVRFDQFEEKPGEFDKVVERLKKLDVAVNIGIRDGYLLFTVGGSNAMLAKLGKGAALSSRPEFKPIAKHGDEKIIAIDYVSKALNAQAAYTNADIDNMLAQGKEALKQAQLPADLTKKLEKDMVELGKDLKKYYVSTPGASMSFSLLTSRGVEGFSYDWGAPGAIDGSQPLTLLQHLGGDPLLAVVGRTKYDPAFYQMMVKWVKTGHGYFEEFALPTMGEAEQGQYKEVMKFAVPLLKRFDKATATMLLPALKDGQSAFVLDGKWKSKQWAPLFVPVTDEALPLPELAFVWGVSDPGLLKKGLNEYRAVFNDAAAILSNAAGGAFPGLSLPEPETKKVAGGMLYYYSLPPFLDPRVLPNGGLSDKVAVFSFSEAHTARILKPTPLKVDGGPLADTKRKLAGAAYFDMAGLIDAATPWIDLVVKQSAREQGLAENEQGVAEIVKQVHVVLDVLKCIRSASSATYIEGDAVVTHTELRIVDR